MTHEEGEIVSGGNAGRLKGSFVWLNATQFLGAFNDNVLKLLIIFFIIGMNGAATAGVAAAKAGAVFVLPFLLFSPFAGVLADRVSKQRAIVTIKIIEMAVTATGAFFFLVGSKTGLFVVLFMMATHSALFAPSKYGIIPELVEKEQLSLANGLIESFSYLAIILGTVFASLLSELTRGNFAASSLFCVGIAFAGFATSLKIERTPPANPKSGFGVPFIKETKKNLKYIARDRELLLAVLGSAFFMVLAAFTQMNLIPYGMQVLGFTQERSGYLFLMTALGIGAGSFLAGKLSGRGVEFGLVPLGAIVLTTASFALRCIPPALSLILPLLFILGFSAGMFIVPLQAFIQLRSPKERLGEILAASVFLNWMGVLVASGLTYLLTAFLKYPANRGFAALGVLTMILTLMAVKVLPDFLIRFVIVLLTRICYRIKVIGKENVPPTGPALLIANHVTWVDALLLSATQQRRIRFVMERNIYNNRLLNPLFRLLRVIPVSAKDSRRQLVQFMQDSRSALDEGFMVCIFAEGHITRTGMVGEFRSGFERIVRGTEYPVIPVYIGGAWGSIFSYAYERLVSRFPVKFPYPVTVLFGKSLSPAIGPFEIKQAVTELSCDYFESLKDDRLSLGESFIRAARRHWRKKAVSDTLGRELTYGRALAGALALAEEIDKITHGRKERIGILLPASVGGVIANLAVTLCGKIPVNLNFTASADAFRSAIGQCDIKCILTSRAFLERYNALPLPEEATVYIEDVISGISVVAKGKAWIRARFCPCSLLMHTEEFSPDDVATIIFSSGSTGEPKGVMLTHHNILSNVEALKMVLRVSARDNVCAALPFFHSLGFTGTIWLPLLGGFSAAYHANPMEGAKIAEAVKRHHSTLLLATPTFLLAYIRRAAREDFASLRLVFTGAEKLTKRIADAFEEKFGIRPLEGYGATELSPAVAFNVPDVRIDGVLQIGACEGSVGHPIPGVVVKVVDPDTGITLPAGVQGLIEVKGPNVMLGYLGKPGQTAEAVTCGWYRTGDIGVLDEKGFLTITDRLSRFSKIGGEMVPHMAIEEEIHTRLNLPGQAVAVTSVPDQKKGEKLIVLCTKAAGKPETFYRALAESPLPNLWKPDRNNYLEVETLPLLGSGKLDIKGLRQMALRALGAENAYL
jgi:acyl-[acyl-carrier-protein]-phospholipid O-acyltransferase/long-chain-fatty-acid--[acyl-carrier-protein] ligase